MANPALHETYDTALSDLESAGHIEEVAVSPVTEGQIAVDPDPVLYLPKAMLSERHPNPQRYLTAFDASAKGPYMKYPLMIALMLGQPSHRTLLMQEESRK